MKMKALSTWQPWAWLIVNGYKDIENRSWWSNHRGPLAIHAGKTFDYKGYYWVKENFPEIPLPNPQEFERGGIVGTVNQTGCTKESRSPWFFGRFGHTYADGKPVPLIRMRGQQGYFDVEVP